jgi:hypothetical protein
MRMADGPRSGHIDDERLDLRPLLRLGAWGLGATLALGLAVFAGRTDLGERRAVAALAPSHAILEQTRIAMAQFAAKANEAERESHRLGELVRTLMADRDQLTARLSQLERNFEDLTGSIVLTQPSRRPPAAAISPGAASAASPPKDDAAPSVTEPAAQVPPLLPRGELRPAPEPRDVASAGAPTTIVVSPTSSEAAAEDAPVEIPLPRPNPLFLAQALANAPANRVATSHAVAAGELPAETAIRSRIGVEFGAATSVDGLRLLWSKIKESQPPLLADLRPLIAVREGTRPGAVELRLVAGPLVNQAAAARLCAALTAASIPCRAAAYDGQRLTVP